jgi:hypothetical protein
MLITGYYEFEIVLTPVGEKQLGKDSKTIYRRFSDIEWLHEGLLKYNPGCKIPLLPEKNIWSNLNVNNDAFLEKRRLNIEEYLNYISKHKFLSLNPNYLNFISNDFDSKKGEQNKTVTSSFYDNLSNLTSFLPIFKQNKMKGLRTIESDESLESERKNFVRLLKAISDLNINITEYMKINSEKGEAMKNIVMSSKNLKYSSLEFKEDEQIRNSEDDSEQSQIDKSIKKNIEIISNYHEKNTHFFNMVTSSVPDQINVCINKFINIYVEI